ncbi:hypothetical protein D1872_51170 [compost metagenome]
MIKADNIGESKVQIDGRWVATKPQIQTLPRRIRDAIQVIKGKAEAVVFEKQ